mgnify:FL=1
MHTEKIGVMIDKQLTQNRRRAPLIWEMKDGTSIRVKDMTDNHLKNAHLLAVTNEDMWWALRLKNEIAERASKKGGD